jgi:4-amino-4-deoxy-L-arabinose transferase-like glycosyltransferase
VVLSAHSLGAVLAVAALFALPEGYLRRVQLLTYGVQLRPYFGRIFPELLGPAVLGTPEVRAGAMFSRDPWRRSPGVLPDRGLSALLGPSWINLWRRTDYLGFPVHGWSPNSVDRRAAETNGSPDKVDTHSDYHLCAEFGKAFADLVSIDLNQPPADRRSGGGNLDRS